jgi:hypothetical protein
LSGSIQFVIEVPEPFADRAAILLRDSMICDFLEAFPNAPTRKLAEPHIARNGADAKQGLGAQAR